VVVDGDGDGDDLRGTVAVAVHVNDHDHDHEESRINASLASSDAGIWARMGPGTIMRMARFTWVQSSLPRGRKLFRRPGLATKYRSTSVWHRMPDCRSLVTHAAFASSRA